MKIRLEHGLVYLEAALTFRGRSLRLTDTILDTGSSSTIFSADQLLEIGVAPEPFDAVRRLRGVGGTEFAFTKRLDLLAVVTSRSRTSRSRLERWITASLLTAFSD